MNYSKRRDQLLRERHPAEENVYTNSYIDYKTPEEGYIFRRHSSLSLATTVEDKPPFTTLARSPLPYIPNEELEESKNSLERTRGWIVAQQRQQSHSETSIKNMGYDQDRFVSPVNDGLLCCICRDVLEDPLQAPCEHAYCSTCIRGWLVHHSNCPEDRRPLMLAELRPLFRYMRNDLNRLQIRCCNSQAGCPVVCDLEYIRTHEFECEFEAQPCPNAGCTVMLERREMNHHMIICQFRTAECPNGCGMPILSNEDKQHNCVAELRNSLELLQSEMICKLQEQRQEMELRLDAQRRHFIQKQATLVGVVDSLRSEMSHANQAIEQLQESERQHQIEKRELIEAVNTLREPRTPGGSIKKFFCIQSNKSDKGSP